MSPKIAFIISCIIHPVFMPIYSYLILYNSFPYHYSLYPNKIWTISSIILLLMTTVFPALFTLMLRKLHIVDDLDISVQKQRIFPYMIFFFFYLLSFLTFKPKLIKSIFLLEDPLIATILLGATISIGVAFFLNNFLKVSIHMTACASLFSFTVMLSTYTHKNLFFLCVILIALIGLLGASRIILKAHTLREVKYGIFCGIIGQVMAFLVYFKTFISSSL